MDVLVAMSNFTSTAAAVAFLVGRKRIDDNSCTITFRALSRILRATRTIIGGFL